MKKITTANRPIYHCIFIPCVFWGVHLGWVFGFPLAESLIPYDYRMCFAILGFVFPIIGTILGVYWNYVYFRRTRKGIHIFGLFFWIICLILFAGFVFFGTSNANKEIAPVKSETIQ